MEVVTWAGRRFVAQGDAYMGPQDAARAATAVRDSLAQLIGALDGKVDTDAAADAFEETEPDAFDVCQQSHFPAAAGTVADFEPRADHRADTGTRTWPGLRRVARFHAELGPFVGVSAAARGATLAGGFGSTQTGASTTGGLEAAVRVGLGLEGVLNESGDGLVFAEVGLRQDAATLGAATLPGRTALTVRLRVPFWLIPGDLLLATPVLAFSSPQTLQNGRAGGQRRPHPLADRHRHPHRPLPVRARTRGGPELLSLPPGRPRAYSDSGRGADQRDARRHPLDAGGAADSRVPPFRTFSLNQSSSLLIQLYTGFDTPLQSSVVFGGRPKPAMRTIGLGGIRVVFDWRYYLQSRWSARGDTRVSAALVDISSTRLTPLTPQRILLIHTLYKEAWGRSAYANLAGVNGAR